MEDKGKAPYELDRSDYVRVQRKLNVAANAEIKTRRKMLRAVGAAPTGRVPDEDVDPDTEQIS